MPSDLPAIYIDICTRYNKTKPRIEPSQGDVTTECAHEFLEKESV